MNGTFLFVARIGGLLEKYGKEIVSWSFNDYRRSNLEKRTIPLDVRG